MVSVTHSLASAEDRPLADMLAEGLNDEARAAIERALALVEPLYADKALGTGEPTPEHARGMVLICAGLRLDVETRLAGILFSLAPFVKEPQAHIERHFGKDVAGLVDGLTRLNGLRLVTRGHRNVASPEEVRAQTEVLRKMLLAMSEDIRVVLLRLASRVQTLRWYRNQPGDARTDMARESLDIYAPLANRLGVAQIKWELEDLSFRYLEPETYKHIASQLDERRLEREQFIENSIQRLKAELAEHHIEAEVYGRPKHIYSIWNKMRKKKIDFSEVYDVRALRVLVKEVDECYGALGVVHQIWTPIPKEFDDYIVKPKGNNYRSLHTAVLVPDGRSLEVQIRTYDMHKHAEMGVAAHWRYKEGAAHDKGYDDKIAWLRHLLAWRDEVADSADWVEKFKRAALDDTIYVLTPAGKVLDLPRGATPVDFAYRLHTEVGHRCRGAKVDGALVPLNTQLESGKRVEIVTAKQGGPSRDWLNPQLAFITTGHAKAKVRRWFADQEAAETLAAGRSFIARELQRDGAPQANIDNLAHDLGYANQDALYMAAGRGEVGPRQIQVVLKPAEPAPEPPPMPTRPSRAQEGGGDRVLVEGVGKLLTQLGRCCKPAPPDKVAGFVTRGKGISIHRTDCANFHQMANRNPERVVDVDWGGAPAEDSVYPVDVLVQAIDRQGLLRDISEVYSREKVNVTAVNTLSKAGRARMGFTVEIRDNKHLERVLQQVREVKGVLEANRTGKPGK